MKGPGAARRRQVYSGYERLLDLPDKESGDADLLGWDARRMRRWLGRLGDPQLGMRCILVAGSKGKGSTCAFLESALRAAGRRTGRYTQPHLHHYRERIHVDGRPLAATASHAALAAVLERAPGPVTAFEAATAAALWAFAQAGVEDAVLELGFGGRLDAVAEVEPVMVLFTPLEVEHAELFGPDLATVLDHELALVRFGRRCLTGRQTPAVTEVFLRRLQRHGAEGGVVAPARPGGDGRAGHLALPDGTELPVHLGLDGSFQWENAALAAAAAWHLGAPAAAIGRGLAAARLPGRFETVGDHPRLIVDGAHTPGSATALATAISRLGGHARTALVLGVLRDKDVAGIAAGLAAVGARVWATAPGHPRALPAPELARGLAAAGLLADCVPEPGAAVAAACAWAGSDGLCVAAGSLAMAAEVRAGVRARRGA